eukprot:Nitzschia sp. Nitz4//scaffold73_size107353//92684//93058//NITZ4_004331-RA/size107353-snap-gene-0.95-mRNA-1//1//CDS//3329557509//8903//frame0
MIFRSRTRWTEGESPRQIEAKKQKTNVAGAFFVGPGTRDVPSASVIASDGMQTVHLLKLQLRKLQTRPDGFTVLTLAPNFKLGE